MKSLVFTLQPLFNHCLVRFADVYRVQLFGNVIYGVLGYIFLAIVRLDDACCILQCCRIMMDKHMLSLAKLRIPAWLDIMVVSSLRVDEDLIPQRIEERRLQFDRNHWSSGPQS